MQPDADPAIERLEPGRARPRRPGNSSSRSPPRCGRSRQARGCRGSPPPTARNRRRRERRGPCGTIRSAPSCGVPARHALLRKEPNSALYAAPAKDIKACACPHPNSASSSPSTTRAPTSSPCAIGWCRSSSGSPPSWEIVFVDDGSEDDTLSAIRARNAARAADRRGVVQPQFRQGDRDRGRARPCPRARRRDHGRRPAAPARGDRDLRRALAGGLRHGLRPAHGAAPTRARSSAASPACSTGCSTRFGEMHLPEGAGDFRLIDRTRRRGAARAGRAVPLLEGALCLDRLQVDRRAVRRRGAAARSDEMELPHAVPLRLRRHHGVLDGAVTGLDLSRRPHLGAGDRRRRLLRGPDAALRRRRARLSLADRLDHVLLRRAAHVARHHRRVYRPHLRRGEAPPALRRGRADRRRRRGSQPDDRPRRASRAPGPDRMLEADPVRRRLDARLPRSRASSATSSWRP